MVFFAGEFWWWAELGGDKTLSAEPLQHPEYFGLFHADRTHNYLHLAVGHLKGWFGTLLDTVPRPSKQSICSQIHGYPRAADSSPSFGLDFVVR